MYRYWRWNWFCHDKRRHTFSKIWLWCHQLLTWLNRKLTRTPRVCPDKHLTSSCDYIWSIFVCNEQCDFSSVFNMFISMIIIMLWINNCYQYVIVRMEIKQTKTYYTYVVKLSSGPNMIWQNGSQPWRKTRLNKTTWTSKSRKYYFIKCIVPDDELLYVPYTGLECRDQGFFYNKTHDLCP